MTWIASIYGVCIQWCLYEAAQIWRLRVPLGIGRNLFVLGPMSWPVKSCSPMGARASLPAQGTLLVFRRTWCTVINTFMEWHRSLRYTECVFNDAFMKRCGFGGWGFSWELGEIYFAWHSLFELCARWIPPDFVFYIRRPRRTIFHIY